MIDTDLTVAWIVDPGGPGYDMDFVTKIINWIPKSPIRMLPSGRYYMLVDFPGFWDGYKFNIGVATEEDADAFRAIWGGLKVKGELTNGTFVYTGQEHWAPRPTSWKSENLIDAE